MEPQTIQGDFEKFHADHPDVYRQLVRLARNAKAHGLQSYGIKALCEVLRWNRVTSGPDAQGWKINNNYSARYARLIEEQEPDLKGFFITRQLVRF